MGGLDIFGAFLEKTAFESTAGKINDQAASFIVGVFVKLLVHVDGGRSWLKAGDETYRVVEKAGGGVGRKNRSIV